MDEQQQEPNAAGPPPGGPERLPSGVDPVKAAEFDRDSAHVIRQKIILAWRRDLGPGDMSEAVRRQGMAATAQTVAVEQLRDFVTGALVGGLRPFVESMAAEQRRVDSGDPRTLRDEIIFNAAYAQQQTWRAAHDMLADLGLAHPRVPDADEPGQMQAIRDGLDTADERPAGSGQ